MAKAEISWKGRTSEGTPRQAYAQRVGGRWIFYHRERRYDCWELLPEPPLEDWLELLDAVRRRIARRLLTPEENTRLVKTIRERFPDAEIPAWE
jgi:hypothetical protein